MRGVARHGSAGRGAGWHSNAGLSWRYEARQAGQGLARRGVARIGTAWIFNSKTKTKMAKYSFTTGKQYKGIDADAAGKALEEIRIKNNNQLRPPDVVKEAKKTDHPLHNAFTWDDKKAAQERRLEQARYLIRVIVVVDETGNTSNVPAFINVRVQSDKEEQQYYQRLEVATKDEYDSCLHDTQMQLKAAVRKLETLKAHAPTKNKRGIQMAIKDVERAQGRL